MKFNEILRNLRKSSGKSIRDVARETGISYDNLGRYERDENEPNIATLKILAKYYGVSLDCLLGNEEKGIYISNDEYLEFMNFKVSVKKFYEKLDCIESRNTTRN